MVTARSAYLNKASEFNLQKLIASLEISSLQLAKRLADMCSYYMRATLGYSSAEILSRRNIKMVEILSTLGANIEILLLALVFPLTDVNTVIEEVLNENISRMIVALIHEVRNMVVIRQIKTPHSVLMSSKQICNVRRIIPDVADSLIIKSAKRGAYLRLMKEALENEHVLVTKGCTNVYATLVNCLSTGLIKIKLALEDYYFSYLYPVEYRRITALLRERRIDRECYIEKFVSGIRNSMKEDGVRAKVYGRPKHIYSIWRKMQRKHLTFNLIFDVRAVRVVADHLQDCYAALRIIHAQFYHLPNEFDNYIANPKPNGYRSIHTVVLGPGNKAVEILIRTTQMHEDAELGTAAHWKYKEGTSDNSCSNLKLR